MFLLVPAYPGCPGSKAVKRSLLLLSGTTQVSRYQKGKTNLDFIEARDMSGSASAGPYASLHLAADR